MFSPGFIRGKVPLELEGMGVPCNLAIRGESGRRSPGQANRCRSSLQQRGEV